MTSRRFLLTLILAVVSAHNALADPCGMVPPLFVSAGVPVERIGLQKTYVFYKNGVETFVIRPGYRGSVDNFGMLIPFPSPPAIRKVSDDIFAHITAAVDPPEVAVYLRRALGYAVKMSEVSAAAPMEDNLGFHQVRVLREEAVGMYEVAVLEAGSAAALRHWMDDHGYRYPDGMEGACNEYIADNWCFVAVKTRVGKKAGVDPRPGQRDVNSRLPDGATFDGYVQAMGFRFHSDELVVPMRLSAFNEGDTRNVVYVLADHPKRIHSIPSEYVMRQISGRELRDHLTDPLPVRIYGGSFRDIPQSRRDQLDSERDPVPHNGHARELFASDLLAARTGKLAHEFEELEKELLRIGERLGLRGEELDHFHHDALADAREKTLRNALEDIDRMTLTVVDGDFNREVLARENLTFANYFMPRHKNRPADYDAKEYGPAPQTGGERYESGALHPRQLPDWLQVLGGLTLLGILLRARRLARAGRGRSLALFVTAALVATTIADAKPRASRWIAQLDEPAAAEDAVSHLVALGDDAVDPLFDAARKGALPGRGWAIVGLGEIGSDGADQRLRTIQDDRNESPLVRTWATAARIAIARDTAAVLEIAKLVHELPPIERPLAQRFADLQTSGDVDVEDLLAASITAPRELQEALVAPILASGPRGLVDMMLTSSNADVRRQAAAYVASAGRSDPDAVTATVIDACRFRPSARQVPWAGGPLFIPSVGWQKDDAADLVENLLKWMVFCDRHDLDDETRKIHNNLASVGLVRTAGLQFKNTRPSGTSDWYQVWGETYGRRSLRAIFVEQNVENEKPYRDVLERL